MMCFGQMLCATAGGGWFVCEAIGGTLTQGLSVGCVVERWGRCTLTSVVNAVVVVVSAV